MYKYRAYHVLYIHDIHDKKDFFKREWKDGKLSAVQWQDTILYNQIKDVFNYTIESDSLSKSPVCFLHNTTVMDLSFEQIQNVKKLNCHGMIVGQKLSGMDTKTVRWSNFFYSWISHPISLTLFKLVRVTSQNLAIRL
jgi:hypothetical protein